MKKKYQYIAPQTDVAFIGAATLMAGSTPSSGTNTDGSNGGSPSGNVDKESDEEEESGGSRAKGYTAWDDTSSWDTWD